MLIFHRGERERVTETERKRNRVCACACVCANVWVYVGREEWGSQSHSRETCHSWWHHFSQPPLCVYLHATPFMRIVSLVIQQDISVLSVKSVSVAFLLKRLWASRNRLCFIYLWIPIVHLKVWHIAGTLNICSGEPNKEGDMIKDVDWG